MVRIHGRASRLPVLLAAAVAFTGMEPVAWSQPSEKPVSSATADAERSVKERMREGVEAVEQGDLTRAREAFKAAWCLKRHPAIAISLAEVEMRLGQYRQAAERWQYALEQLPPDKTAQRAEVEAQLAECRKRLGRLKILVAGPGARVFVDGEFVGTAPIDKEVWVDPGQHTVHAELGDRRSRGGEIAIQAGERRTATLTLEEARTAREVRRPQPPPQRQPPPPPVSDSGLSTTRTAILIGGGVAVAATLALGIGWTIEADADQRVLRQV